MGAETYARHSFRLAKTGGRRGGEKLRGGESIIGREFSVSCSLLYWLQVGCDDWRVLIVILYKLIVIMVDGLLQPP